MGACSSQKCGNSNRCIRLSARQFVSSGRDAKTSRRDDASLFATKEDADAYASRVAKARLILFPSGVVGTPSHGFRSLAIQNTIKGGKR